MKCLKGCRIGGRYPIYEIPLLLILLQIFSNVYFLIKNSQYKGPMYESDFSETHIQAGGLAGAAHLSKHNTGVRR